MKWKCHEVVSKLKQNTYESQLSCGIPLNVPGTSTFFGFFPKGFSLETVKNDCSLLSCIKSQNIQERNCVWFC